jgi:hypothetical protein
MEANDSDKRIGIGIFNSFSKAASSDTLKKRYSM